MEIEGFVDKLQDFLQETDWYQNLGLHDKLDVVESLNEFYEDNIVRQKGLRWSSEAKLLVEKEKSRKMYHACLHAFQWHCGNGTEEAEKECMRILEEAIQKYNKKEI